MFGAIQFGQVLVRVAQIALLYNFVILIAVVLDQDWVRTRAAGGQFESFPVGLRVFYFMMAVGTCTLLFLLRDFAKLEMTERRAMTARYLGFVFVLSTFLQLISRSSIERWNAIPAIVIATAFLFQSKRRPNFGESETR